MCPTRNGARLISAVLVAAVVSSCQSGPRLVYVPASEPEVTLFVAASATDISVGDAVTLHAERRYEGEWKQVEREKLTADQCWMVQPPSATEDEVADNLRWESNPPASAQFNTGFREDHTRQVVFQRPGTYVLNSTSTVWCRPEKRVHGQPITITVR
ncbi:MAG TPA: hypothetical protein VFY29_11660 [Terriglobia bacterium]|nr:hypothetical protein [Terriglobia bacterium]